MNTTEKKFLFPRLYPLSKDISKKWFIKYQVEDFFTGGFKNEKYYGALNMIADKQDRERQAVEYIRMMQKGEALPDYRGMKRIRVEHPLNFANAIECCYKYLNNRKFEIEKLTISDYRSRINTLAGWLQDNKLQHLAIGGITKDHARSFMNYLKEDLKLANKTYNSYKILFGTIWSEYVEDGKIALNPWRKIHSLPDDTKHFDSYPPYLQKLISETLPEYDPQLWLVVQTVYYCAIRPHCELRLMKVGDLSIKMQSFLVRKEIAKGPKGKKRGRHVTISTELFSQYIDKDYHNYPSEYYLFSKQGIPGIEPVSKKYFGERWKAYRKKFDISSNFKLYGSKHTGGKALSKKYNSYIAKEHFGHSSMQSTEHYTSGIDQNGLEMLQKGYPKFAG